MSARFPRERRSLKILAADANWRYTVPTNVSVELRVNRAYAKCADRDWIVPFDSHANFPVEDLNLPSDWYCNNCNKNVPRTYISHWAGNFYITFGYLTRECRKTMDIPTVIITSKMELKRIPVTEKSSAILKISCPLFDPCSKAIYLKMTTIGVFKR